MHYDIPVSTKAITRIIRQAGLLTKTKKTWKIQTDLTVHNQALYSFQLIQVDDKHFSHTNKYWPQMRRLGLLRYHFSARDVLSGRISYSYGTSKDSTNGPIIITHLLSQHKHYGVNMTDVSIHTHNADEFVGHI